MSPEQRVQLEALIRETEMGLVNDDEFARRADEIGVSDEDIEEMMK